MLFLKGSTAVLDTCSRICIIRKHIGYIASNVIVLCSLELRDASSAAATD